MRERAIMLVAIPILFQASLVGAGTVWQMPAAACMPADPAIQNNRYTINGGAVLYNGNNVDLISLYCPVNLLNVMSLDVDRISMTYRDSDGNFQAATIVAAALWKMDFTGSIFSVATISSNMFPDTGIKQNTLVFSPVFLDFTSYNYYIRIDMDRGSYLADTTAIYSVSLNAGPF